MFKYVSCRLLWHPPRGLLDSGSMLDESMLSAPKQMGEEVVYEVELKVYGESSMVPVLSVARPTGCHNHWHKCDYVSYPPVEKQR